MSCSKNGGLVRQKINMNIFTIFSVVIIPKVGAYKILARMDLGWRFYVPRNSSRGNQHFWLLPGGIWFNSMIFSMHPDFSISNLLPPHVGGKWINMLLQPMYVVILSVTIYYQLRFNSESDWTNFSSTWIMMQLLASSYQTQHSVSNLLPPHVGGKWIWWDNNVDAPGNDKEMLRSSQCM